MRHLRDEISSDVLFIYRVVYFLFLRIKKPAKADLAGDLMLFYI